MKEIYLFLSSSKTARNKEKTTLFPGGYCQRSISSFSSTRENAGSSQKGISSLVRSFRLRADYKPRRGRQEKQPRKMLKAKEKLLFMVLYV
jgi:hypothetical protein